MALRVYNTLTRRDEEFKPLEEGRVRIYVCGITPYDKSHIGHARPSVFWDVVRRYLTYLGYQVTLVQNFTDIEDKLIAKSKETGIPPAEIAEKYAADYLVAMDKLGVQRADAYPRASQVIPEIIEMTKALIAKGYAYESSGDVYFRAEKFKGYGKLSGKKLEELRPGARVEVSDLKESPLDWALWKASPEDEPGWPSPWGRGRPGWHIECSVMVQKYLGTPIDMHGGGTELIFPHHENEIAQSEAYFGKEPYVRYWIHHDMLNLEGEKMSKSLGNVISLDEILRKYDPMAVRLYLLSAHRRKILEFSDELLRSAEKGWERIRNGFSRAQEFLSNPRFGGARDPLNLQREVARCNEEFFKAMDDDFNTPSALASIFDLITAINAHVVTSGGETSDSRGREAVAEAYGTLLRLCGILGLAPVTEKVQDTVDAGLVEGVIKLLTEIREKSRKEKDYRTADAIRERLSSLGILLEDTPAGTKWRFIR
ncbi:MAG TPA: cysteine--tRNA ligase [Firmicutes bacterium]|nr:cysteine--tRNA ligase [Candidatus Fermentithermobacillaceae bacterium]